MIYISYPIPAVANLLRQLDWIENHLGDTPLTVSVRVSSGKEDLSSTPWARVSGYIKKEEKRKPDEHLTHHSVHRDPSGWECSHCSSLEPLLPPYFSFCCRLEPSNLKPE